MRPVRDGSALVGMLVGVALLALTDAALIGGLVVATGGYALTVQRFLDPADQRAE